MTNLDKNYQIMRETLIDVSNSKTSCDSQTAIYALRYIQELQDKLTRRNRQIKELKKKQNKMFNDCIAYNDFLQETKQNDDFAEWFLNR